MSRFARFAILCTLVTVLSIILRTIAMLALGDYEDPLLGLIGKALLYGGVPVALAYPLYNLAHRAGKAE